MSLKSKLKLADTASEAEVEAAVDQLIAAAGQVTTLTESNTAANTALDAVRTVLNLDESANVGAAVKSLAERTATLEREKRTREADAVLDAAIREGKIPPAMRATYREQLLSEIPAVVDAAKVIIEKSPKIVPLAERKAEGKAESQPATNDREKLLDEKIKELRKETPSMTYADALVQAERILDDAARQG